MHQKTEFEYSTLLEELGYLPVNSKVNKVLIASTKACLEKLGKSYSDALLYNMCSLSGLTENELLTNFELFEDSLYRTVGKAANSILHDIKKEILIHAVILNPSLTVSNILDPTLTINDVLKGINEAETLGFMRDNSLLSSNVHIILLYKSEEIKDKILSAFFDTNNVTKCNCVNRHQQHHLPFLLLSEKATKVMSSVSNILYEDLLQEKYAGHREGNKIEDDNANNNNNINDINEYGDYNHNQPIILEKISNLIRKLTTASPSRCCRSNNNNRIRIAEEDASWWIRNGFFKILTSLERLVNTITKEEKNFSFLCAFNISKFANGVLLLDNNHNVNKTVKEVITYHDYVIVEGSPSSSIIVYKLRTDNDKTAITVEN
jgi:hypothetical protein